MPSRTSASGTRAVMVTQQGQVAVIFVGLLVAGYLLVHYLPAEVGFTDALRVAGRQGKLNLIDFHFDPTDRYNFWSGMTGGLFLALSYFGTDQSQVQRYLTAKSVDEARSSHLISAYWKIPLQALILLVGVLVVPRLIWRLTNVQPVEVPGTKLEHLLAKAAHVGLYGLMIIMPLTGYLGTGGAAPIDFYLFTIPKFPNTWLFQASGLDWKTSLQELAADQSLGVPEYVIEDDGPGIPPAERERVFDRFWRRDSGRADGSGLGLAIAQAVAQRHGGRITLTDSPLGAGDAALTPRWATTWAICCCRQRGSAWWKPPPRAAWWRAWRRCARRWAPTSASAWISMAACIGPWPSSSQRSWKPSS